MAPKGRPSFPPMLGVSSIISQTWPPKPDYTEENVPDLSGKASLAQETLDL